MTRSARHEPRVKNWVWGLVLVVFLAVGSYVAYTKELPFSGKGYTLHATFDNAATIRASSPVRIAGVNVGEVTGVTGKGDASEVTFTVKADGLPIHEDAQLEIRPRLFLEGNFFLDLQPGSPSAPELSDGATISNAQTGTAVQLDEVLTALQSDSREDLQLLLEGYGTGLTYEPTAADDATQDPDVAGETAAESLNDSFVYGGPAGRDTAIVNEALLGENPHDLSGLFKAQRDTLVKLADRDAEVQGLITNFNVTMGALAAEQSNVSATFRELAPTLEQGEPTLRHLSDSLPPLRALARVLEPSVRELPGTIKASGPWLEQANLLLRDEELGGLARLLGDSAAPLARTAKISLQLFPELTNLGRCTSEVLEPAGDVVVNDAFSSGQSNFHELFYGLTNLSGEMAGFDGNGPYLRLNTGGGPVDQMVVSPNPSGAGIPTNQKVFGRPIEFPDGVQPALPSSGQPPFKPNVLCHTNAVPDVNGPAAAVGAPDLTDATP